MRIALVRWVDAESHNEPFTLEEARAAGCPRMESVGWLADENAERVVLATDRCIGEDYMRCQHTIPWGMIEVFTLLPEPEKQPARKR
jgi:hypothetical protein